jgi:hypothetical protein
VHEDSCFYTGQSFRQIEDDDMLSYKWGELSEGAVDSVLCTHTYEQRLSVILIH